MAEFTDFKNGLQNANDYLDARHHLTGTSALGSDALRIVSSAEYSFTLRELLCGLLSGNGIKMPNVQICLNANINELLGIPNLQAELQDALGQLSGAMLDFMDHTKLDSILGRLNGVLAEAQNVANMINFCSAPVDPIAIPNMLENAFGSFLGAGQDIINQIGSIVPGQVCACIGTGGFNSNVFNGGILGTIANNIDDINAGTLGQSVIDSIRNDIESVNSTITNLISTENNINGSYTMGGSQFATPDPNCNTGVGVMHNPAGGSIASNARLSSSLKSLYDNFAGYPVRYQQKGSSSEEAEYTEYPNIFHLLLDDEMIALLDADDDPNPTISNQIPVYDYCGNIIGYTQDVQQRETQQSAGSTPTAPNSPGYLAGGLETDQGNDAENNETVGNTTVQYNVNSGGGTVYIVSSESSQLALQTNTGDIVVRSDILTTWIRKSTAEFATGTMQDYQQASVTFTAFGENVNELSGEGFVVKDGNGAVSRILVGTANQIEILNPDGKGGNPTIKIANNPIIPGIESIQIPKGTTSQRSSVPASGQLRYNTDLNELEAYYTDSSLWQQLATLADVSAQTTQIINVGTGAGTHKQLNSNNEHEFRSIKAGGLVTVTQNTDEILLGDNLTLTSVGGAQTLVNGRFNNELQFKTLTSDNGITITDNGNTVNLSGNEKIKYTQFSTTNDTSQTVTFNGVAPTPDPGKTWMYIIHVMGGDGPNASTRRGWKIEGMVQNASGSDSMIGTPITNDYQRTTNDMFQTPWTTLTSYAINDIVEHNLILYRALQVVPSDNIYPPPDSNSPVGRWAVEYSGWNAAVKILNGDFVLQVRGDAADTVYWSIKFEFIEL